MCRGGESVYCVKVNSLGALIKWRKATIRSVMSVRPSAWNNSAFNGRIFMKFDI